MSHKHILMILVIVLFLLLLFFNDSIFQFLHNVTNPDEIANQTVRVKGPHDVDSFQETSEEIVSLHEKIDALKIEMDNRTEQMQLQINEIKDIPEDLTR